MIATLPRVSTILRRIAPDAYAHVSDAVLAVAAARGRALHQLACQKLASMAGLCEAPLEIDAEYVPCYLGLCEWLTRNQVQPIFAEEQDTNETLGYTGTPDAKVLYGAKHWICLPDFKFTASVLPINLIQLAAYWHLPAYADCHLAMIVHIHPVTGIPKEHRLKPDSAEWATFLNALHAYHKERANEY